jgi:cobalt-zinc-cadmium efflux system membrane fusion protein
MRRVTVRARKAYPLLVAGALLLFVVGAFFLGRRSVGISDVVRAEGGATDVHSHEEHAAAGHGEGGHEEHSHDRMGVVRFTPEALAKAGIEVRPVISTSVQSHLQVTGTIEPNIAGLVKVTPRVAGKITSLRATIGDLVRTGQVLATMTSTELATAQAQYRQAGARVAAARANLRRQRQLASFGEFGQHKVQDARGSFNAAQGDVNEVLAEINAARNEVAEAEAAQAAAQSEVVGAESDVAAAETVVAQAETQVEVTRSRFNRQDVLLKEELTSRQDWEQARADYQKAQTDVLAAQAAVRSARAKQSTASARAKQAKSLIDTQRARLRQAQAKRVAALERLTIAAEALEREEKVYRSGVFASKEVADAEAALRQAEIERDAAVDAVCLFGGTPGGGNTLAVAAPLAGRITERAVTAGETVSPEKPLFTVVNLETVWVQLNVYPRDLSSIRAGLPVTLTTESVPGKQFAGTVAHVGDVVDETTRTVKVRCVIPNPSGLLKPEMFVRGRIATPARRRGIAVPRDAVQTHEGKTVVFIQGDHPGEFEAKEVQTGETLGGRTVIASGLQPGDPVVTRGAFTVKAQAMKSELGHEH